MNIHNTSLVQQSAGRAGWSAQEDALLFACVQDARSSGAPLKQVAERLQQAGLPSFDPYKLRGAVRKAGRPRKQSANLLDVVGDVVNTLDQVEGLDVSAFFESLGALAVAAAKGTRAQAYMQPAPADAALLLEANSELKAQLHDQRHELSAQRERFTTLLGYFRQLMNVNREFLGLASVSKMSSLGNYIRELSRNVEDCEKCLLDSK